MKKLVATGVLGIAAISAFAIYSAQKKSPDLSVLSPSPAASQEDIRAQITADRPVRSVESNEAKSALERMGLWEQSDTVSWEDRTGENGNYTFTNLNISSENDAGSDVMSASEFEITGVRLLDSNIPYYDTVSATDLDMYVTSEKTDITASRVGINMPDSDTVAIRLKNRSGDVINSPIEYIAGLMEPGTLPALPEIFVENLKTSKTKEVRFYGSSPDDIMDQINNKTKPVKKQVKDITTTGFAALSKVSGTENYNWQISNFAAETHNFMGKKNNVELAFLDIAGLDSKILDRLDPIKSGQAGDLFDPFFNALNLQGFKFESETDIFQMGQATVIHSDSRGDQFSRQISVPQMTISAKPLPQTNEGRPWSGNPFAKLGYDKVDFSLSSKTDFDKITGTISDTGSRLTASDAFDVTLGYKVSNIDSGFASLMMFGRGGSQDAVIEFGEFSFTDKGILDRVHEQLSEEKNMSVEDAKAATKASFFAMKMMAQSDYQKELATAATNAYGALIDDGGKIQVSVRPQRPVSLKDYFEGTKQEQANRIYGPDGKDIEITDGGVQVPETQKQDSVDDLLRALNISVQHSIAD